MALRTVPTGVGGNLVRSKIIIWKKIVKTEKTKKINQN